MTADASLSTKDLEDIITGNRFYKSSFLNKICPGQTFQDNLAILLLSLLAGQSTIDILLVLNMFYNLYERIQ